MPNSCNYIRVAVKMRLVAISSFNGIWQCNIELFYMLIKCLQTFHDPVMNGEINPLPEYINGNSVHLWETKL